MNHPLRCGPWITGLVQFCLLACAMSVRAEEPFDYFRNNWNVIGLKDYDHGTRVTPDNRLLVADGEVRLRFGEKRTALSRRQSKTLVDGWLPIIVIEAQEGRVRYEFTLWATPLPSVKDWQKAFDWPTEGENFLNWITVKATNTGPAAAKAAVFVELVRKGISEKVPGAFLCDLAPAGSAKAVFRIPFTHTPEAAKWAREDATFSLDETVRYWRGVMAPAARIVVPCRKATDALLAAHVCQLIANDHGVVHGGEGFYDEFYIRDGAYQVMELEEAGMWNAARRSTTNWILRVGGRMVVRKCAVPGICPKPVPGTTQTPVRSSRSMQYCSSVRPAGSVTRGNAYMAPATTLHWIPGMRLSPSANRSARAFSSPRTPSRSCAYRS